MPAPSSDDDDWEQKNWSGKRQRQALKGFERLKAILWKRSLAIYQWLILGDKLWFRRLSFYLFKHSFRLDLHTSNRVHTAADVFGETPIITVVNVLEIAKALLEKELPEPFIDLGCGRGVSCLSASSLGLRSIGYEKEAAWIRAAERVAKALELSCSFVSGDFLSQRLPEFGTYFVVATAFSQSLRDQLERVFGTFLPGTILITLDWRLSKDCFDLLWQGRLPVDWGTAEFAIWHKN